MVLQIIFKKKKTDTENDKSQAFWMKSSTHVQCVHLIVALGKRKMMIPLYRTGKQNLQLDSLTRIPFDPNTCHMVGRT